MFGTRRPKATHLDLSIEIRRTWRSRVEVWVNGPDGEVRDSDSDSFEIVCRRVTASTSFTAVRLRRLSGIGRIRSPLVNVERDPKQDDRGEEPISALRSVNHHDVRCCHRDDEDEQRNETHEVSAKAIG